MLRKKSYHYQIYHCLKVKLSFHKKLFQKEKNNYCYGLMLGDFQVICGSMVGENRQLPASTETPVKGHRECLTCMSPTSLQRSGLDT